MALKHRQPATGETVLLHSWDDRRPIPEKRGIVLVEFYAAWCTQSEAQRTTLEEVARTVGTGILVGRVDVREAPVTVRRFNVLEIPTLVLLDQSDEVNRFIGIQPSSVLLDAIANVTADTNVSPAE